MNVRRRGTLKNLLSSAPDHDVVDSNTALQINRSYWGTGS